MQAWFASQGNKQAEQADGGEKPFLPGLLAVIPADANFILTMIIRDHLQAPLLSDPGYLWHNWLRLGKFSWWEIFKPQALAGYFRHMIKGRLPAAAGNHADLLRQGGDILLNQTGQLLWARKANSPADRPKLVEIQTVSNHFMKIN